MSLGRLRGSPTAVPALIDGEEAKQAAVPRVVLPPADINENRRCVACHGEAAGTIAAHGGPHGESITMGMCSSCHSSHDVDSIRYGIDIPDAHCTACHKKAAATLQASGTRHMGLACVVCHRSEHARVPSCVDCHSGPHARRVMSKPERCVKCHNGAHETKTDR